MTFATFQDNQYGTQSGTDVSPRDATGEMVFQYIQQKYVPLRHAAKLLAKDTKARSLETARKWLSGRSTPRGDQLMWLCVRNEELQMLMHNACCKLRETEASKK